jgi:hypothetical protein
MQQLRDRLRNPWVVAGAAFLAGLILGWLVIGWWIWPVDYIDATPAELRSDVRLDYLRAAVDSFALTGDANAARQRFSALGSQGPEVLGLLQQDPAADQARVRQYLALVSDIIPTGGGKITPPAPTPASGTTLVGATRSLCGLSQVVSRDLVLGGVLVPSSGAGGAERPTRPARAPPPRQCPRYRRPERRARPRRRLPALRLWRPRGASLRRPPPPERWNVL